MDKYQATVAVKKAALTWILACLLWYAYMSLDAFGVAYAGTVYDVAFTVTVSTIAFPLMYLLRYGTPEWIDTTK